ncbi:FUSC family protein [Pararobbsia alpina]|uniref:Uncharacterized protein n=1 Tax=Pararobbsia alpina TaxID=621374 RepID=A0A6S7CAB6_9BURK|nr:FUSC family protein [Pararobbsia alpina]CAB3784810.1 hypothetical protein LMG28138_01883 [Pararobbsia alpina]
MRYPTEIKKFLYSQYFYGGLRIAFGISLPVVLALLVFQNAELGFTISAGALAACAVDMPGPLKYKHNEMLTCSVLGFLSALVTGIATAWPAALFLTVVLLSFALSLIVLYGVRWPQISFATLFMMILTMDSHFTLVGALVNASWILVGGLWYTYWSTTVSRFQRDRIEQQAIAENLFAMAEYVRARAAFYDLHADLDECYRNLVQRQIATVDKQDAARDIALRNLPRLRDGKLDAHRMVLFNLFINSVDLHEGILAAQTDYAMVRNAFGDSDLMMFFRDLLEKLAGDLEYVGLSVLRDTQAAERVHTKAEFRAIEYEIDQLRKKNFPNEHPEAYASIVASYRRIWSAARVLDKMRANTHRDVAVQKPEMPIDKALDRFLQKRRVQWGLVFSNLTMASPSFRHALRVAIGVALGFWLGRILPLTHSYWICMTTIIILKPGFSMTRQRNTQRIVGTAIGCAASVALVLIVHNHSIELLIMMICMVMAYSLTIFNYTASVAFTSAFVLILYQMLTPMSMGLIGERAIDTVVGCALAIGSSYLFPYWEYRLMGPLVKELVRSMRRYLDAIWPRGVALAGQGSPQAASPGAPTVTANTPLPTVAPLMQGGQLGEAVPKTPSGTKSGACVSSAPIPTRATDTVVDSDFARRLASKNMQVAYANLGNAFQRMMLEPKSQQRFVAELHGLLVQSHVLGSQMAAASPLLSQPLVEPAKLGGLDRALGDVRENLLQIERAGTASPTVDLRELTRALDSMVVAVEKEGMASADAIQDLKLLAYQSKQMIAASRFIRKDVTSIRLPV